MAKIKKKGVSGQAKNFITRTQAVRKLQLSLPDFRKLCIWKGIYPREPRSKKKVSKSSSASTTFYYTKDIQYLAHEPLLTKFREQKTLEKKIARALGRGNAHHASQLERNANRPEKSGKSIYSLDHIIRERYPTFIDALRDLDDCLSMLFLFANLPSTPTVPAKIIAKCEKLCLEFEHYLIVSNSLRKSFLSIKGIYYQASIYGQDLLWLVPYRFNQRITNDVDFRIMGTFVEFYQVLLGFVNFRLYTSLGLVYPPKFDKNRDDKGAELDAFSLGVNDFGVIKPPEPTPKIKNSDPKLQAEIDKLMMQLDKPIQTPDKNLESTLEESLENQASNIFDKFEPAAPGCDILPQPEGSATNSSSLFSNFTFYLSRETPRQPLEFLLRAFGCNRIGWDSILGEGAFTYDELDPHITHQIVDRPCIKIGGEGASEAIETENMEKLALARRIPGRIYIQPQWVWDSINDEELKRPDLYAPGAELPPHFSPFVKKVHGQYDPRAPLEEQEGKDEELLASSDEEVASSDNENDDNLTDNSLHSSRQASIDSHTEKTDLANNDKLEVKASPDEDSFTGFSDSEEEEEEDDDATNFALRRQKELEAELNGITISRIDIKSNEKDKNYARKLSAKKAKEEAENIERATMMMSRKKRKIMGKMMYSNLKKNAEAEMLRSKRRKLEKSGKRNC
ncbi:putative pescadillo-similar protein [Erysiphe necator]|uniref:Pescadillo homolog n=1 Tax=Uncinula necator TaxID=52586 RepID=A0A0B1NZ84_UNCNE|nr:putative pescadillo-similar protein [Erysiphe necator]